MADPAREGRDQGLFSDENADVAIHPRICYCINLGRNTCRILKLKYIDYFKIKTNKNAFQGVRTARLLTVSQHVLDEEGMFAQVGSAGGGGWQTPHGIRGRHHPVLWTDRHL